MKAFISFTEFSTILLKARVTFRQMVSSRNNKVVRGCARHGYRDIIMCKNTVPEFSMDTMVILSVETDKYLFSIRDAMNYMLDNDMLCYLEDMLMYNVPIRDAIRNNGIRAVADKLLECSPNDEKLKNSIERFVSEFTDCRLADFDIQILPTSAKLNLYGKQMTLNQLADCVELTRRVEMWTDKCERKDETLHVAKIYEPYPCFDAEDYAYEKRKYENYIIRDYQITEDLCLEIEKESHQFDNCFVVESLSAKYLPMVYYDGDSRFMLVATAKDNPQVTPEELAIMKRKRKGKTIKP